MINNNFFATLLDVLVSLIDVLLVILPVLLAVAFMTIIERKQLAAHQRRVGPNTVGYYGILQPFSDALKLILKETVIPSQSNKVLFYLAPVSTLIFSLLGWGIIPFGQGLTLFDFSLGILYTLALSSLGVYGILFAGWSANSKYAFLGSLRSTAAMISYELILSSAVLIVILLTGSFNFTTIIESQQAIWFVIPLLPVFIFYFISILAETSRTPFDLQEAESELVAGFFTEHSSIIFVFFFLAEYSSIVLFSTITAILFFGGYNMPELFVNNSFINLQSIVLGLKTCVFCFMFVWFRATLPRLRYDQLVELCWLNLLPVAVAFIILVPSILIAFDISPYPIFINLLLLLLLLIMYINYNNYFVLNVESNKYNSIDNIRSSHLYFMSKNEDKHTNIQKEDKKHNKISNSANLPTQIEDNVNKKIKVSYFKRLKNFLLIGLFDPVENILLYLVIFILVELTLYYLNVPCSFSDLIFRFLSFIFVYLFNNIKAFKAVINFLYKNLKYFIRFLAGYSIFRLFSKVIYCAGNDTINNLNGTGNNINNQVNGNFDQIRNWLQTRSATNGHTEPGTISPDRDNFFINELTSRLEQIDTNLPIPTPIPIPASPEPENDENIHNTPDNNNYTPDETVIPSVLENSEIMNPIVVKLKELVLFEGIEIVLVLLLAYILFYKHFNKFYVILIKKLILFVPSKYLPKKINNWIIYLDKPHNINNKFNTIISVIVLIMLFCVKLFHLFMSI